MEEKELKLKIEKDLKVLIVAYNVDVKKEILDKWINIIFSAISNYKRLNVKFLEEIKRFILENYPMFRTINASVYLTAYRKIFNNNNPF